MGRRDDLLTLIDLLYAAPGTDDGWPRFLERLRTVVDGTAASFISHDLSARTGGLSVTVRVDPVVKAAYDSYWAAYDPWMNSDRLRTLPAGSVTLGDELIPHAQVQRTAYYTDLARPNDIVRVVGSVIEAGPARVSVLSINGSERRGPFSRSDADLLSRVVPHIRRGLQLHRRLTAAETRAETLEEVTDRAACGVLLIESGRVVYANREAERILLERDGLTSDGGELRAAVAADTNSLRALIERAALISAGEGLDAGRGLAIRRPSGRRPLTALVLPVARSRPALGLHGTPSAMVLVTDPHKERSLSAEVIGATLDLTRAEARLVVLLAEGHTEPSSSIAALSRRTSPWRCRAARRPWRHCRVPRS